MRAGRTGLYAAYFFGVAAIGFILPYLPVFLREHGLSDSQISWVWTIGALSALVQFPVGLWADRMGTRQPFLLVALTALALSALLLPHVTSPVVLAALVIVFAENGLCRAVVESLCGAEATARAAPGQTGTALGLLRFWKPVGIILVALLSSLWVSHRPLDTLFAPLAGLQMLGAFAICLLPARPKTFSDDSPAALFTSERPRTCLPRDGALWAFVAAMVLFHVANAPGGVYLSLLLEKDLEAPRHVLGLAFVVSMVAWTLVVWPAGRWADRRGRRPFLIAGWLIMATRLAIVALARTPEQIVANQALDGVANGLFAVLAGAWVTDRLADSRRVGEAQVIVGTALVFGSALGPALSAFLVEAVGYRPLFGLLAGIGFVATAIVVLFVPETLRVEAGQRAGHEHTRFPAEFLEVTTSAEAQQAAD